MTASIFLAQTGNGRPVAEYDPPALDVTHDTLAETSRLIVHWVRDHGVSIVVATLAGIAIYLLLRFIRRRVRSMRDLPGEPLGIREIIGRTAGKTTHFFMIMVAARLVSGYAGPPPLVAQTIAFLFTIAVVFQGAIWAREFILGLIERKSTVKGSGETIANAMGLIRLLVSFVLFAIALIVVLDNLGVNVTGLVAGLGIGGIAIGLAAQGIFSDLFAALSIIFDRPFRTGDTIKYDQTTAKVERIGLKSTKLRSTTGERKVISNANLLQKEITNFENLRRRRISFPIGVPYDLDPVKVEAVPDLLRRAIEQNGCTYVRAGFLGFGGSSLDFECLFDVPRGDLNEVAVIRHNVGMAIIRELTAAGISFASPRVSGFSGGPPQG